MSTAQLTGEKMTIVAVVHQHDNTGSTPNLGGEKVEVKEERRVKKKNERATMEAKEVGKNRNVKKSKEE
jgi:hypothetical protein